ncbi:MAG: toxic anion resistance protein [Clostridia bacterium]|nr:toxic anion resistance protein [Clostridia bacterium]
MKHEVSVVKTDEIIANNGTVVSTNISYEELDEDTKKRVDAKVEELKAADTNSLLTFGIESQTKVTQYANNMLTKISSGDKVENIEGIMEDVLDVTKPFVVSTEKKNFFQRLFAPKGQSVTFDRSMFAGKVDNLVEAIDTQIGRLISDNIMYDDYIDLLVDNVNSITETIMALQQYINEVEGEQAKLTASNSQDMAIILKTTENSNLLEQLKRRLNMFMISRQESMQVAVSARIIQKNNAILSDRMQTLLVVGIPILQNQILLKASMADTKKGLDICDSVSESIDTAMKQNASQLNELTARISSNDGMAINVESVVDMSKDILSIAEQLKKVNSEAKEKVASMEDQIKQSDASLTELFNMLSAQKGEDN